MQSRCVAVLCVCVNAALVILVPVFHWTCLLVPLQSIMEASGLSGDDLFKIWNMSDIDGDGLLDVEEFAVAMYLIKKTKESGSVPDALAAHQFPPSKR